MTASHLFVMDPLSDIDPTHDTTYVIIKEVESRNIETWVCRSRDLVLKSDSLSAEARRVSVEINGDEANGNNYYRELHSDYRNLESFEVVWMREDPPFDLRYLHSTYLLERAPVKVVNSAVGIRNSNEKLLTLEFPEHLPPTWVGSLVQKARMFLDRIGGRGVAKTLEGFGGEEVFQVNLDDPNCKVMLEHLTEGEKRPIMIQKYLPEVLQEGDRRVLVLGGEPIGGLTRYPAEDDFRSNIHSGGRVGDCYVRETEERICQDLRSTLLERGLHFVGLDLIGDKITEINVTSPTCVQEINRGTNQKLQTEIVDYVLSL